MERPKKKNVRQPRISITQKIETKNAFNVLENDNKYELMQYKSTWLLDSAVSGMYADMNTIVKKRKKVKKGTGIKVGIANKSSMRQVATGEAPFLKLPTKKVDIFPTMGSPLLGCGPIVQKYCTVVLENTHALIVTGKTRKNIQNVLAEADNDILLTVPFDENTLTWRTRIEDNDIINEMEE